MKVMMVGSLLRPKDVEEMDLLRRPIVILTGTIDEIREAGRLLYQPAKVVSADTSGGEVKP